MQKYNGVSHVVRDELDITDYHFGERRRGDSTALCNSDVMGNYSQRDNSVGWPELLEHVGFMRSILAQHWHAGCLHEFQRCAILSVPAWRLPRVSERSAVRHFRGGLCEYMASVSRQCGFPW